ncbi:structural maintenance of chromosome 4 [Pancytospora philotis]|nr:structural maintenance of chromosome 4 [Pancytospora philotis]
MVLKLEGIRIHNFKSFQGTHEISGLDSRVTAIVGPNGSGKSNIIDSILFVLGYRARKMRHAVLKDLVASGCADCRVELVFNSFSVARALQPSGRGVVSRHYLDGVETPSAEVQEYLRARGIDLDNNRFLILQGEIENIAMLGPLELLAYIEDCIGTTPLQAQIEAAATEVRALGEAHESASAALKYAESDHAYKKERRDEKVGHLAFRRGVLADRHRIVQMKAELGRRRSLELGAQLAEQQQRLAEIQERNAASSRELQALSAQKDELCAGGREDALLQSRKEAQAVQREIKLKEARKEALARDIKRTEDEAADCARRIRDWERESASYRKQIAANDAEIAAHADELSEKAARLEGSEALQQCEAMRRESERSLVALIKRKEGLVREESEIAQCRAAIAEIRDVAAGAGAVSEESAREAEACAAQVADDLRATTQEIQKRQRRAEDFRFVEEQCRREQAVASALESISGVHGPLKGLGAVARGYDVAVEAATKALGSIVVSTTAVAEECIAVINKKQLSRTTFIILDRLPEPDVGRAVKGEDLLYRRIECRPEHAKAFYFALKDTIVAQTMEEAKRLAFGSVRRRVVTIDGKLLEKSGIMSGGKTQRKLKGIKELEDSCENMRRILAEKRALLEQYRGQRASEARAKEQRTRLVALEKALAERLRAFDEDALRQLDAQIRQKKEDVGSYENANLPTDIKLLRGEAQILREKIDYLEQASQALRIKLSCEPRDTAAAAAAQLDTLRTELAGILVPSYDDTELRRMEKKHQAFMAQMQELQDGIARCRSAMGSDYHEEAGCKGKLGELEESRAECEKVQRNCAAKISELQQEFKALCDVLDGLDGASAGQDALLGDDTAAALSELGDEDLRLKSRKLIEKLSAKEAQGAHGAADDILLLQTVLFEYQQSRAAFEAAKESFDFLTGKINALKEQLEQLKARRHSQFMEGFSTVNGHLKEIFALITFGGNAELDLLNYLDPFAEGVVLSIMPPKKAWKQIANLSGGEKTLSSLALIFALHKFSRSDLYIMDEIDAALDYKNVSIIAQYLEQIRSQFIIISLRDNMFERANTLLGVYKTNNASKAVLVDVSRLPSESMSTNE